MHFQSLAALAMPAVAMAAALPKPQEVTENQVQIVGGVPAQQGDFPFIISMQQQGSHICGGSLIDSTTVLTAAHCAVGQSASAISIRAGTLTRGSGGTVSQVSSIKVHPSYNADTSDNDVAILKLRTPIAESATIKYVKLAAAGSDPASGSTATVAGWGRTSSGGPAPTNLLKVSVPIVARNTCKNNYPEEIITNNMFCAGVPQGGKDSCQGDSGGPIVDSSNTQIGVVSWGYGCAQAGKPGVYASVGSLSSFIKG